MTTDPRREAIRERWEDFDWSSHGNAVSGEQAVRDIHDLLSQLAAAQEENESKEVAFTAQVRDFNALCDVIHKRNDDLKAAQEENATLSKGWGEAGHVLNAIDDALNGYPSEFDLSFSLVRRVDDLKLRAESAEAELARLRESLKALAVEGEKLLAERKGWSDPAATLLRKLVAALTSDPAKEPR